VIVLLDPSAAIDIVLKKGNYNLFAEKIETADTVIAPELYISEIANVSWKYHKRAGFSHEEAITLAEDGILLVDTIIPVIDLWKEVLRESMINDHPVYDLLYVIAARRNDALVLTKDKRIKRICKKFAVKVV